MPDEDKNFGGSLVLDFGNWWRHVKTIYWQSVTENKVFMIIKLDVASNAVSPFWIIFFVES